MYIVKGLCSHAALTSNDTAALVCGGVAAMLSDKDEPSKLAPPPFVDMRGIRSNSPDLRIIGMSSLGF